jgi:hypothetical protein
VKPVWVCIFAAAGLCAESQSVPATLGAPKIGHIEYYGIHKLSPERIKRALGLKTGDPLPPSKGDVENRLDNVPGVVDARLEAVCCGKDGNAILFVGIEEKGGPHFAFRSPPAGSAVLPPDVHETYDKLVAAVADAAHRGSTAEDLTQGHALAADPDARALEQSFVDYARDHLDLLREVVRNSSDPDERALAAAVIGYAPDKAKVVGDLEYAMQDPDESVRANAMRSLTAIAVLAVLQPQRGIHISPTWFVEMLNSVVLSDRVKASTALVNLTQPDAKRDARPTLEQIRERALGSVLEMAQWQSLRYALPSYILLGRMAGVSESVIQESWSKGQRDTVVMRFVRKH